MGKKQPFDSIAPRNLGALIASGSAVYVIRRACGADGDIYYATPILDPDRVCHLGDRKVQKIPRTHMRQAIDVVLKQHGCFYT